MDCGNEFLLLDKNGSPQQASWMDQQSQQRYLAQIQAIEAGQVGGKTKWMIPKSISLQNQS